MAIIITEDLIVLDSNLDWVSVPSKTREGTSEIDADCVDVFTPTKRGRIEMENVAYPFSRGKIGDISVYNEESDFVALIKDELSEDIVWL
jgi:hypothetical protein